MTADSPQQPDFAGLVRAASEGDDSALMTLLRHAGPGLRMHLASRIGSVWRSVLDEDDVLQVTFLEAFLRMRSFRPPEGPGAADAFFGWLRRIAENNLTDAIRGLESAKRPDPRRRMTGGTLEESFVALVEVLGATSTTPSRVAARDEAGELMRETLEQLPPDYGRVITLYDLQGKSVSEVAKEMCRTEGAVFMLRARAHDRLKDLLGSESRFFSHGS
ncbi:MAG: RNA polymerase sigma factor [Phycisphaerales bacterium]